MSMYDLIETVRDKLKDDEDLTDIVPKKNIHGYHHPNTQTTYPLIVVTGGEKYRLDTDSHAADYILDLDVLTQQNTAKQLGNITDLLRTLLNNVSLADVCNSCSYFAQLDKEFPVDTSELKLVPRPLGASMRFIVTMTKG